MKWKAKNSKVVYVSPYGVVTPVKAGTTKIYGYTKDGTNKRLRLMLKLMQNLQQLLRLQTMSRQTQELRPL